MRAVVQRIHDASVVVEGEVVGSSGRGFLVYLGVQVGDTSDDARFLSEKIKFLRVFPDDAKPMNRDITDVGGSLLVVSAFTVAGDARRGRRPSFDKTASPTVAEPLYEEFCTMLTDAGLTVARGRFGEMMEVHSNNDGPICILLDSKKAF